MANDLFKMFESPEQVRARIGRTGMEQDLALAGLRPGQLAAASGAQAGRLFAEALGGMAGYEYPEVTRAKGIQQVMQEAVTSKSPRHEVLLNAAEQFKSMGMGNEAFQFMMAGKQAEAAYKTSAAQASLAERRIKKEEGMLRVAVKNAYANTIKAQAAMMSALTKNQRDAMKGMVSKPVSSTTVDLVGGLLADDKILNEIDGEENVAAYVTTMAQAAQDLVAASAGRIDFNSAIEQLKLTAQDSFEEALFSPDAVNTEDFRLDVAQMILEERQKTLGAVGAIPEAAATPEAAPVSTPAPAPAPATAPAGDAAAAVAPIRGGRPEHKYITALKKDVAAIPGAIEGAVGEAEEAHSATAYAISEWLRNL